VAQPLRFRFSPEEWDEKRVRQQLLQPLRANIGARSVRPRFDISGPWQTYRFEMTNDDLALFASGPEGSYWLGNTETPEALWRTNKHDWDDVPYPVVRWAQRELLATLHEEDPWLEAYPYLSWFFLPVFMSKDGRESTRAFFREHAAGFPNIDWQTATKFVDELLASGVMDEYRYLMAGKLGTSKQVDHARMDAAMGEFIAAKILADAGYEITPEIEVTTGHSLDFRASNGNDSALVEVTRPVNPNKRSAGSAVAAVRDTASTKTSGQLSAHGGGAILFVDCSSFDDQQWQAVIEQKPAVGHRPAVVYRVRPTGETSAYREGTVPLDLAGGLSFDDK